MRFAVSLRLILELAVKYSSEGGGGEVTERLAESLRLMLELATKYSSIGASDNGRCGLGGLPPVLPGEKGGSLHFFCLGSSSLMEP